MNQGLQTDPELRVPARCRGLLWSCALLLLAGLLAWQVQGGAVGATGVQSVEASLQALGEEPDNPGFTFDLDVDDPPAPQPLLPILFRGAIVTADISEGCRFRCGAPLPARAPPLQPVV